MGTLSDILGFEAFNAKDIWGKIRQDPERLLIGAIDPFSTEMWNRITGSNYDPLINQLGGPMGSGWAGLGENGGVYQRAQDQGINTKHSESSHDVAELVASIYGGSALGGLFGGGGSAAGGGATGASGGSSGAAGSGGLLSAGDAAAIEAANASAGMAGTSGVNAASGMGFGSPGFNWTGALGQGAGLLGSAGGIAGQPQQGAVASPAPPPQQGKNEGLQQQMARSRRMQELRRKIRKTPAEQQELQALMRNGQGLL